MARLKPLPALWLVSDERNDAALETELKRMSRRSGFIFRHYHLPKGERRTLFDRLARVARARGHLIALAGSRREAKEWGADLAYGSEGHLAPAHNLRELARAHLASAVLLSPVFPTRSHPGAKALGPLRFRLLAARAQAPVIALGGMNPKSARRLKWPSWAGIDAFLR
jgi:thiamine-phosphate pyrophosphorylase